MRMNKVRGWVFVGALLLLLVIPAFQAAAFGSKEKTAEMQATLDDTSVQLAASDMLIADRDAQIEALNASIAALQAQIDDLQTRVGVGDMLIAEREKALLAVDAQAASVVTDLGPFADKSKDLVPVLDKVKGIRTYIAGLEIPQ
jgi:cell division protein FtsB